MSLCLSVCLSISLSLSTWVSLILWLCLSLSRSASSLSALSVYLCVCISLSLTLWLSVCLCLRICLYLSSCTSILLVSHKNRSRVKFLDIDSQFSVLREFCGIPHIVRQSWPIERGMLISWRTCTDCPLNPNKTATSVLLVVHGGDGDVAPHQDVAKTWLHFLQ